MLTFFRVSCLISCCLASLVLFYTLMASRSYPQQAAGAAIAIAFAVIPYVFTRMAEALAAPSPPPPPPDIPPTA